ncbi:GNAT family N-acetyltransferase [Lactiplantibacillus paraplantarum]|uniref:GNAT family N-acetyltransferase n=1 Tax=Lactiplantibacillus paraplantarum TaxID=60520 RepID=UPI000512E42D|nr:GNAT family N-acetyltransferase [Lactiplantibacillus paraplantarum]OAX76581.1 acetyltransferase [Lactiplantibacillus plantarum]ALO04390.1 acetyltransferase [Lactiplantibacillus paraplantarum]KGE75248.1 acetyltransferase [Lactiplantibacillus paraplantarum]MCW1910428.1 GNAT family N-acetyltransferase [Lactiplantibacillus paraplantarum]RDG13272.1 GNAT family N-acetyltransferase [Lactiplantibacillus paraplantarum]
MLIKPIHPADRTPHLISQLTQLWRQSVDASHHFLTPAEITAIEQEVPAALRTVPQLLVAMNEQNEPTGFIGIDGSLIAMLFITPTASGTGIGTALLQTSIQDYGAITVTVNEQNPRAQQFYEHRGFYVTDRQATDDQGRPYPLLTMTYSTD